MRTIFDRMRRSRRPVHEYTNTDASMQSSRKQGIKVMLTDRELPEINERITVTMGEHIPVPSRIEDISDFSIEMAEPSLPLSIGDNIVITWESSGVWCSFSTTVELIDSLSTVPTVQVSRRGYLTRHDERREGIRHKAGFSAALRVIQARAIRSSQELTVRTSEIGDDAIQFVSSASFSPNDIVEARVSLGSVSDDVNMRLKVIRVDSVSGSWRCTITASYEEILRSDKARLLANAANFASQNDGQQLTDKLEAITPPVTEDGVGGRDEPESISTLQAAVEWLKRRE